MTEELKPATPGSSWSNPSPVYHQGEYHLGAGWVFIGRERANDDDYTALEAFMNGKPYDVDGLATCGRYDRDWTTANDELVGTPPEHMLGGYGSSTYQMQLLYPGVQLTTDAIWLHGTNTEGDPTLEKVVPPNMGAYYLDDNQMARAGAEPGSHADKYIGEEGIIYFARLRGMYDVKQPV